MILIVICKCESSSARSHISFITDEWLRNVADRNESNFIRLNWKQLRQFRIHHKLQTRQMDFRLSLYPWPIEVSLRRKPLILDVIEDTRLCGTLSNSLQVWLVKRVLGNAHMEQELPLDCKSYFTEISVWIRWQQA